MYRRLRESPEIKRYFVKRSRLNPKRNIFNKKHKGPYGPIWAPTRTGPQPGLGPNPARAT